MLILFNQEKQLKHLFSFANNKIIKITVKACVYSSMILCSPCMTSLQCEFGKSHQFADRFFNLCDRPSPGANSPR